MTALKFPNGYWLRAVSGFRHQAGPTVSPLIMRGGGVVAGLFLQVLLARLLGAEAYGVMAIAMCLQAAAVVIGRAGLDSVIMQVGGPHWFRGNALMVRGVYEQAMRIAALNASLVAMLLALGGKLLTDTPQGLADALPWMSLSIVPASLLWVHSGMLRTVQQPTRAYLVEGAMMPVLLCLMIALAGLVSGLALERAAMLYCLATSLALVPAARMVRAALPAAPAGAVSIPLSWRRHCLPVIGVDALNFLLAWMPFAVLAVVATSLESGLFNVASRLALQVGTVLVVLGSLYSPRFSALHAAGDAPALEALARRASWLMIAFGSVPLAALLLVPGLALWVFGPDFAGATDVLQLLALGQLCNALTGPAGFLLVAAGEARRLRAILAMTTVLIFPACWWAAEMHGAAGAALAASLGIALQNLLASAQVWRRLGIQHIPFLPARHGSAVCAGSFNPVQEATS